jgi:hypothetical protein
LLRLLLGAKSDILLPMRGAGDRSSWAVRQYGPAGTSSDDRPDKETVCPATPA